MQYARDISAGQIRPFRLECSDDMSPDRHLSLKPLSPAIGVEVLGIDLARPLSAERFAHIRHAWEEHCVVLFRNQRIEETDQVRFASAFGPLATLANPERATTSNPAIMLISNIRKDGKPIGALPDGELQFHSDQCYVEMPATGTMLYAIEVPSNGGNTLFANMFRAYDDLSAELKNRLGGKLAVHGYDYTTSQYQRPDQLDPGAKQYAHPIFRTHPPTGRKALYVSRLMTQYIVGLPRSESDGILAQLFEHLEQPKYLYEHAWNVGDLLFWDNRSSVHARRDFDPNDRRLLRRITLLGEKPY
jgi:taurine dioxygenase